MCRGLCDTKSLGKLTAEQFALAMHLIQKKLAGTDPPAQLTPEMIPPSLRAVANPGAFGVGVSGVFLVLVTRHRLT